MFFRLVLFGISFAIVVFLFDVLIPKLKSKYRHYKKLKERKRKELAFKKKMEELEIK